MKKMVLFTFISFLFYASFGQSTQKLDYLAILKRADKYDTLNKRETPEFTYQSASDFKPGCFKKKFQT